MIIINNGPDFPSKRNFNLHSIMFNSHKLHTNKQKNDNEI